MQTEQIVKITEVSNCRACGSASLTLVIDLGNLAVSGFVKSQKETVYCPLELLLCKGCSLVQLRHSVDPDILFRHFWYQSSISSSMQDSLRNIVNSIRDRKLAKGGDWIIDIGCNDGTLLQMMPGSLYKAGFEPAVNMAEKARKNAGARVFNEYFNAESYLDPKYGKARLVTAIAMFYDVEKPVHFCKDVARVLREDGTFLIQMNYLPMMLGQNNFDNICHEHLGYYSLSSLNRVLGKAGLEAYDVELNQVNGGSFRVFAGFKDQHDITGRVKEMIENETRVCLDETSTYGDFMSRITENGFHLREYLWEEKKAGRKTWIMGASTRGNTLLQFYRIDGNLVKGAVDKNPEKWGLRTVGTDIPVWSRTEAIGVDNFLVLPYHFLDEFKEQEKRFLKNGGRFLVPLPKFWIAS